MNQDAKMWRAFLPYLINASKKVHVHKRAKEIRASRKQGVADLRLEKLTPQRKDELEKKVKGYYVDRKYEPMEKRLKTIRSQFQKLKKITNGAEVKKINEHIKNCNKILRQLKKAELQD